MYEEKPYEPETHFEVHDGVEVAAPALLKQEKSNRCGSVPDLTDEECADPDELERQMYRDQWKAILVLPKPKAKRYNLAWDFFDDVDFNAFASADYEQIKPEFDKLRYKSEKLREEFRDLRIRFAVLKDRIPGMIKYQVLKYVRTGIIDADDIVTNCSRSWTKPVCRSTTTMPSVRSARRC